MPALATYWMTTSIHSKIVACIISFWIAEPRTVVQTNIYSYNPACGRRVKLNSGLDQTTSVLVFVILNVCAWTDWRLRWCVRRAAQRRSCASRSVGAVLVWEWPRRIASRRAACWREGADAKPKRNPNTQRYRTLWIAFEQYMSGV